MHWHRLFCLHDGAGIFLLVRWTGGAGARRLVGEMAGLCVHSNFGQFYHSLSEWVASGDDWPGSNVALVFAFVCNSGGRIFCHRSHARGGSVWLEFDAISCRRAVKRKNINDGW